MTRPLWLDRRFVTYWTGNGVSEFGDRISELAVPLIAITLLHSSTTVVGALTAAVWAPNLVSLFVGSWVDQRPRKRPLLIWSNLIQAAALVTLPMAYAVHALSIGQLFVVALVAGCGRVLAQTSYPPFFVGLVRKDQYVEANALLSSTRSASFVAGPAVGGWLISVLTAPAAVLVDALSFLVAALTVRAVPVEAPPPPPATGESLWHRSREGLWFVTHHPYLRASLGCATTMNFFSFVVNALVVLFAVRTLGLSAAVIGLAFGVGATGGLVGVVLAPPLARVLGTGVTIAIGSVAFCAPFALIPLAGGPLVVKAAVLATAEFIGGIGVMLFYINNNAVQTAVAPDHMRSRSAGAFSTVNYGIRPLGALLGGIAGQLIGVGPTMVIAAVGGSLSFLFLLGSPVLATRTVASLEPVEVN